MTNITYDLLKSLGMGSNLLDKLPKTYSESAHDFVNNTDIELFVRIAVICRTKNLSDKDARLFSVWCARYMATEMNENDLFINTLTMMSEKYANGEIKFDELIPLENKAWELLRSLKEEDRIIKAKVVEQVKVAAVSGASAVLDSYKNKFEANLVQKQVNKVAKVLKHYYGPTLTEPLLPKLNVIRVAVKTTDESPLFAAAGAAESLLYGTLNKQKTESLMLNKLNELLIK